MRDNPHKRYSRSTVNSRVSAILFFLDNNDIELNKRKIRRYYPSDESTHDDRPYTTKEIQQILSLGCTDLRSKAVILLLVSSGVRIGALHTMQIGDLTELNFQNSKLYKVQVYARTRDKYITFCTPECYNAIQEYLVNVRRRYGEDPLKDKSPLFRRHFNKQDPFTINIPKFMSESSIIRTLDEVLRKSAVKTSEARRSHAFRKGFKSICEQSGMKSINVELLMGHNIGVSGHYYRPAESDILEDYMTHAADGLTISNECRLKKQLESADLRHSQEWETLKAQINKSPRLAV
jgi:integrase